MVPRPEPLIVALATPPGRGALALIRLSGAGALDVAGRLAGGRAFRPRVASHVSLILPDSLSESALVTTFTAPHSFTGEDVVEISTHGSPVIVEAVIGACLDAGARLARAGEFTFRAYMNGRLDLLQAEAVADLVTATTTAQVRVASAHLQGTLSEAIRSMGDEIAALRALLEASLDFPDEGFHFIDPGVLVERVGRLQRVCDRLLQSASSGRRLHDGALVVIAGLPNAGKSSLFNALLGRARAIVTAVPGTTRDLLTEAATFGGVPVTLVDTAGIREARDAIEREGITRAEESLSAADVVVVVVDSMAGDQAGPDGQSLWSSLEGRARLCVVNKMDLWEADGGARPPWCPAEAIDVSARDGRGVGNVERRLAAMLGQATWEGETLTRARHRSLMAQCASALAAAATAASAGASEEYVLADLRDALGALEELRGIETPEDVLATIFSTFCIGK
jgi:tRNA modification GTPase